MYHSVIRMLLLLIGHFFLTCHAKLRVCLINEKHVEYDNNHQICCNGEIQMRVRDQECCGNKFLYFTSVSLCCGGSVQDRYAVPEGGKLRDCSVNEEQCREHMCCGERVVDREEAMCCNHQPVYLNHTQQLEKLLWACCGSTMINKSSHFCCGGKKYVLNALVDCCNGEVYDKTSEKCLSSLRPPLILKKYEGICGNVNKKYDTRVRKCCSGILHDVPELDPANPTVRNPKFSCCDGLVYDNSREHCCRESRTGFKTHLIPRQSNIHCCGEGSYNISHQDCYQGKILEKVSGKVRCGYGYIDGTSEKCCSNMIYDPQSQECCTGDASNVISKDQSCCNGEGINENMLCCEGITSCDKTNEDDDECCYNYKSKEGKSYNSNQNKFCVNGEVIQVPPNAEPCGDSNFYFPETQVCCGEEVYSMSQGYDDCCHEKPYKSKTQQCCNYEISNISPQDGSCCSKDFKVYRFNDARNPCRQPCGNQTYDDTMQACCQETIHTLASYNEECCGASIINSYDTECCGGQFPLPRSGTIKCCGGRELYSQKHSTCKKNKVVPKEKSQTKLSDVQHLCTRTALKYFDGGVQHACKSRFVVRAKIERVVVTKITSNITYIRLSFYDVVSLERGHNFSAYQGSEKLTIHVEIPDNGLTCKKSYITRYCRVIIFFNGKIQDGNVKVSRKSKFFITSYTRKKESYVTRNLSHQFCRTKFNVK